MAWWVWPGGIGLDIAVLLVAVALDAAFGEPPNAVHPVAWMGKGVALLKRLSPQSGHMRTVLAGLGIAVAVPAAFAIAAGWAGVGLREAGAVAYILGGAVLLKTTFAVRGLRQAAVSTGRELEAGDLVSARRGLGSLVGRDPASLDASHVAGAAVESVAENSTDGYIAPWLAFALFGLPGAFAYRAINTADSMIGYRGRYERLGKASARLDDAANLAPARISALLILAAGALLRLPAAQGWRTMRRDSGKTASPNAGWTMGAMSGLLGVRLVKPGHYSLGEGFAQPGPDDLRRAVTVSLAVAALGVALTVALLAGRHALFG